MARLLCGLVVKPHWPRERSRLWMTGNNDTLASVCESREHNATALVVGARGLKARLG